MALEAISYSFHNEDKHLLKEHQAWVWKSRIQKKDQKMDESMYHILNSYVNDTPIAQVFHTKIRMVSQLQKQIGSDKL